MCVGNGNSVFAINVWKFFLILVLLMQKDCLSFIKPLESFGCYFYTFLTHRQQNTERNELLAAIWYYTRGSAPCLLGTICCCFAGLRLCILSPREKRLNRRHPAIKLKHFLSARIFCFIYRRERFK